MAGELTQRRSSAGGVATRRRSSGEAMQHWYDVLELGRINAGLHPAAAAAACRSSRALALLPRSSSRHGARQELQLLLHGRLGGDQALAGAQLPPAWCSGCCGRTCGAGVRRPSVGLLLRLQAAACLSTAAPLIAAVDRNAMFQDVPLAALLPARWLPPPPILPTGTRRACLNHAHLRCPPLPALPQQAVIVAAISFIVFVFILHIFGKLRS